MLMWLAASWGCRLGYDELSRTVDAGDAGRPPQDASMSADGSTSDAQVSDAQAMDATMPEAGMPEAGIDATAPEAGPDDAGNDAGLTGPLFIARTFQQSCVVYDERLYCWGDNNTGELGLGDMDAHDSGPQRVEVPAEPDAKWKTVCGGQEHTCASTTDGRVACWGRNNLGQLGFAPSAAQLTPRFIDNPLIAGVQEVSCQGYFTCALLDSGTLYCWGDNEEGSLGMGSTTPTYTEEPQPVDPGLVGATFIQITTGEGHACAIRSDNALLCWGRNSYRQVDGEVLDNVAPPDNQRVATPHRIGVSAGISDNWTSVSGGIQTTCAIRMGRLYCWGTGGSGQLGLGDTIPQRDVPTQVGSLTTWRMVSVGNRPHACGLTSGNDLYCWGMGEDGQLGNHVTSDVDAVYEFWTPQLIGTGWLDVATGAFHTCGRRDDQLYCWGKNTEAQVTGIHTDPDVIDPLQVTLPLP